jgi:hypothetical protein
MTLGLLALGVAGAGWIFVPYFRAYPIAMTVALVLFTLHGALLFLIIRSLGFGSPNRRC